MELNIYKLYQDRYKIERLEFIANQRRILEKIERSGNDSRNLKDLENVGKSI